MPRQSLNVPSVFVSEHICGARNVLDCDIALHFLLHLGMDGLKIFFPEHVHLKALLLPSNLHAVWQAQVAHLIQSCCSGDETTPF